MLLHVCCAPDATIAVEKLRSIGIEPTLFFYNPNIEPKEELEKRMHETVKLSRLWNVKLIVVEGGEKDWYKSVSNFLHLTEGSKRCEECVKHRLLITAQFARERGYKVFTTTLTASPKKNAKLINTIGLEFAKRLNISYFQSDFKKQNGFLRSVQLSKELGLYRQNYCGCLKSLKERNERNALHNLQQ
ncbi:epoxyqueuosine reductase QueH [Pseudothermotoga sp.]|nr:epoxyqueuosine reductase QueH [Pseudothermotoga sp.]MCX7812042.1 epoxyqueuosine reductase QueH [Pseudothermotoga sp.]MDW8139112.1 epoxyqueuosine reductase QueH [Pseudothermotoga sp.]